MRGNRTKTTMKKATAKKKPMKKMAAKKKPMMKDKMMGGNGKKKKMSTKYG